MYPKTLIVQGIFEDNKLLRWKISDTSWENQFRINEGFQFKEKKFFVKNDEEACDVFYNLGKKWLQQFEYHDEIGLNPDDIEQDEFEDPRFKIICPLVYK